MCTVCGCGESKVEGHHHDHDHHDHDHHHDGHNHHGHDHDHPHDHHHDHRDDMNFGGGLAGVHVPGLSQGRIVQIEQDILGHNNRYADRNRARLAERGIFAVNLVSSPGSGKTTLLCRTVAELKERFPLAVIEGDQQTSFDADRIRATGVAALQVNTGKGCHLDAHMVGHALEKLPLDDDGILFIENVGNLVCPAAFDLGEACKVVILSVTEGEDKPLKYPDMFAASEVMILNKVDLLPYLSFDVDRCVELARRVNPNIRLIRLSATSGEGMGEWLDWLTAGRRAALEKKAALLEARLQAVREHMGKDSS